ncbi:hypothetical protein IL306_008060 [Fusarium sp. DS 682]|nr:hypothetical protein IL306_008060 [Fusarium sp. DS 682]
MADKTISEERYAEICQIVGCPFAVSPKVYMERLQAETSRDNSLAGFLNRASQIDMSPPINDLRFDLTTDLIDSFDLFSNDEAAFVIAPYPGALSMSDEVVSDPSSSVANERGFHPSLIALETSILPRADPGLVLPVGQLQTRFHGQNHDSDFVDTNYVLVIDAVAPEHPVWLIYDRNPRDELGDRRIVDPRGFQTPLIFEGLGTNFDSMQVLPSVKDWIDSYGNLDFAQVEVSMKNTGMLEAVQAKHISISYAAKLLRQLIINKLALFGD